MQGHIIYWAPCASCGRISGACGAKQVKRCCTLKKHNGCAARFTCQEEKLCVYDCSRLLPSVEGEVQILRAILCSVLVCQNPIKSESFGSLLPARSLWQRLP